MNEFEAIEKFFLPLSFGDKSALNLADDVAYIEDENLIISTDTLVEGTHFRINDDAYSIGQKLIRVNVSDIIAKGGKPYKGFLNICWNNQRSNNELKEFSIGLKDALIEIAGNMPIIGGDTTKINGPIVISLTILAHPIEKPIKRQSANLHDIICVTGNIGDAKIGLEALENNIIDFKIAISHYQIPKIPKLETANIIANFATSSLDISDGLLGDLKKLLPKNNFGYLIDFDKIPFSNDAIKWLEAKQYNEDAIYALLSFGDDYQSAFTIDEKKIDEVKFIFEKINQKISFIGKIINENSNFLQLNGKLKNTNKISASYIHNL